jgi:hypothetical protein
MPDSSTPVPEQSDWDDREILWERKAFYVVKTPMWLNWPWRLDQSIHKALHQARAEGYQISSHPMILLGKGLFHGEVLVEISGVVAPAKQVRVFNDVPVYTAIAKASAKELRKISKVFSRQLHEHGKEVTEIYYWLQNWTESQEDVTNTVLLALEG